MIISMKDGRVELYARRADESYPTLTGTCARDDARALAKLCKDALRFNEDDGIFLSSTMDFPDEYGAPEGYDGRGFVDAAMRLLETDKTL